MKERYHPLYSRDEVHARIGEIASQIVVDYQGRGPLFVSLLRGANPFGSKLMFAIDEADPDFHPDMDYMMVKTYGDSREPKSPEIVTDLSPSTIVAERDVIVIDDVLDLGITSNFVCDKMRERGARSVELAVLASKNVARRYPIEATYCGFETGDNWLVGMGMDDAHAGREHMRWREAILEVVRD